MQDIYIGQMLDNRYEILEKIGTGGMAVVYKAMCHRLNRLVAIKILKDEFAQDADFRKRFYAESQAVAMMSHPNIVAVYDVSHSNNIDYIVMELIDGITLKQYINHRGALSWKETLHFASQITKALSHAHSRGIVHRDIKPQNIIILKDGSIKVADFGIAHLSSGQNTLTRDTIGSVHYMSPEQAKGGVADARSDIYSVGVVMYEMLTGRLPFEGDSPVSVAIQHISSIPLMPRDVNPDIPAGLEAITMHAMESSLRMRYASADELLHDLEEFRKNPDVVFGFTSEFIPLAESDETEETRKIPVNTVSIAEAVQKPKPSPQRKTSWTSSHVTKEEYARNRRRSGRTSLLVGIFCICIVLIALFVFIWKYFLRDMLKPEEQVRVSVPTFVGKGLDEVLGNGEYEEFYVFDTEEIYDDEVPEGRIISQTPKAGSQAAVREEGIDVHLTVSKGEKTELMPDFINTDYRVAKTQLEALQLDLKIIAEPAPSEDVTSGYVMDQVPLEGEQLVEGGTVYLTYSSGPEIVTVKMPEVTALTEQQAKARLDGYDLSYEITYANDEATEGLVIFQSYQVGDDIPVHSKVTLIVSLGPLLPEPSPEVTPDVTPAPLPETAPPVTDGDTDGSDAVTGTEGGSV